MNNFDGLEESVMVSPIGKKRKPSKDNHERENVKKMRHSGGAKFPRIACVHNNRFCHAGDLTGDDIAMNFDNFYQSANKVQQDERLLLLISVGNVQRLRKRVDDEDARKDRNVSVKYSLLTLEHPSRLPVCKATFISILGVSKDRVSRVARYYAENAKARPETRGGARKVEENKEKKNRIQAHIETFKCRASHYGRRGAPGRKYLPSDLSVQKMYNLFNAQNHADVSYSLYYTVFRDRFNLSFGHPVTDACADCSKYRLCMKDPNLSEEERRAKSASFILHRRRARVFYDLLGSIEEDSVTVCFDMMQNLVLPKTHIGQAYYSRQLYMYLFGVVVHHGKDSPQNKEDINLYTWMEHENKKDSNLIASALDHFFRCEINGRIRQSTKLRLFSDSCFGQNKNINVLAMLFALKKTAFPNLRITFTFPIRGHSFLPADRVFGRIEQSIRKLDTILLPKEYISLLKNHGNVYQYGVDWEAFDYKKATQAFVKGQKTFKISDARMLEIKGDQVGFKPVYNGDYCLHSVLKRGKKWGDFKPHELPHQSTVKVAKRVDVQNLLAAIGASEEVTSFYEHALADADDTTGENSSGDEY